MPNAYASQTRYLIAARRSVDKQDGTSIPRQVEAGEREVITRKGALAGIVKDEGVSGAVDFPDRPKLAGWLTPEGLSRWDCLIVTTQDRLSRDDLHFNAFMRHMLDWNKQLIILDDPTIDLHDPDCRMILTIKATQAAKELKKIRQRATETRAWLRSKGFQGGGNPSFGYLHEKQRGHFILVPEYKYAAHLRRMAKWIREERKSRRWVATQMNKMGVLSWTDYQRMLKAKGQVRAGEAVTTAPRGVKWTDQTVGRLLRNPAVAGFLTHRGEIVTDDMGEPLMATEYPILTVNEWRQTVAVLDAASSTTNAQIDDPDRKPDAGTYSAASRCANCAGALYLHRQKRKIKSRPIMTPLGHATHYENYRCRNAKVGNSCDDRANCQKDTFEGFAEYALLDALGDLPEVVRMWDPGDTEGDDPDVIQERMTRLASDYANGKYETEAGQAIYWQTVELLNKKLADAKANPRRPARTWYEKTGRTWEQKWARMDTAERKEFLAKTGVRIVLWRRGRDGETPGILVHLGDLREMATAAGALPEDVQNRIADDYLDNVSRPQYLDAIKRGLLNANPGHAPSS